MTTIVWKPGVLATDKRITDDNLVFGNGAIKAVETEDKVYAITGTITRGLRFVNYLRKNKKGNPPRLKDAVVVEFDKRSGRAQMWESRHTPLPCKDFYVAGSGGQIALGALEMGATPEEAIRVASKYDAYTGNGVQVWRS